MKKNIYKVTACICILCIFCIISFEHSIKEAKVEKTITKVIAHRGCTINAPENTMKSIMLAAQNKTDYVEFDVQETKDGIPVLLHDASLRRTAGVDKKLSKVNYSELKNIYIGKYKEETIPTLEQVMKLTKGKIKLDIELKMYSNDYDLPNKVTKLIERNGFIDKCIVSSFDYKSLVKVKTLNPKIKTSLVTYSRFNYKSSKWIDIYSLNKSIVTKNLIDDIHKDKKQIYVWVVNSDYDMNKFIKLGVDGIITNKLQVYKKVILENRR